MQGVVHRAQPDWSSRPTLERIQHSHQIQQHPNKQQQEVKSRFRNKMAAGTNTAYGVAFVPLSIVVHVFGVLLVALVLAWTTYFRGGLSLSSSAPSLIFNIHPVLMVGGFIFISSEAILVYKTIQGTKRSKKLVHLSLQAVALILASIGIWAALEYHMLGKIDNFYSLHSWLGVTTFGLFLIQWVVGFLTFWSPGGSAPTREALLPWHVFLGLATYVLAVGTAVSGLLEKITFLQLNAGLPHYATEAMFVNTVGILLVVFGALVVLAALIAAPREAEGYQPIE